MMGADDARCNGATGPSGKPRQCCVLCERRVIPQGAKRVWYAQFEPVLSDVWTCDGRIPYSLETPGRSSPGGE